MAEQFANADEFAMHLARVLQDALEIEGLEANVYLVAPRKIRFMIGRDRYEATVVRKRV